MSEERRTEALGLALTYYKMKLERYNAANLSVDFAYKPDNVVKTAEEFEHYIRTGKSYY